MPNPEFVSAQVDAFMAALDGVHAHTLPHADALAEEFAREQQRALPPQSFPHPAELPAAALEHYYGEAQREHGGHPLWLAFTG